MPVGHAVPSDDKEPNLQALPLGASQSEHVVASSALNLPAEHVEEVSESTKRVKPGTSSYKGISAAAREGIHQQDTPDTPLRRPTIASVQNHETGLRRSRESGKVRQDNTGRAQYI